MQVEYVARRPREVAPAADALVQLSVRIREGGEKAAAAQASDDPAYAEAEATLAELEAGGTLSREAHQLIDQGPTAPTPPPPHAERSALELVIVETLLR